MVTPNKLDKYEKLENLGEGTYGIVYRARDKTTNQIVALKEIRFESECEGIPSTTIREISLLKDLQHPNIVKLYDFIHLDQGLIVVLELLDTDLRKLMKKMKQEMGIPVVKSLLYQLLKGIAYCHQMKVLHRDLKPQNLLVTHDGILKLGDFGLARGFGIPLKSLTHEVVTLWYRPPDALLGSGNYSTSIDIWSVGCIFVEMVNHKALFPGQSEQDQLNKIFQVMGTPDPSKWPGLSDLPGWRDGNFEKYSPQPLNQICPKLDEEGLDLLDKMLKCNPSERITAKEALSHPFFKDIPDNLKNLYTE